MTKVPGWNQTMNTAVTRYTSQSPKPPGGPMFHPTADPTSED